MDEFHANVRAVPHSCSHSHVPAIIQVYDVVRQIPAGKVTTYGIYPIHFTSQRGVPNKETNKLIGHIAKLVDKPTYSRHVGQGQHSK